MNFKITLQKEYNINAKKVIQQQGGWASLAYKVISTDNTLYFLKVYEKDRASTSKWTALIDTYIPIVVWLGKSALKGKIIEPTPTIDGKNKCEDEKYIYILFKYIDGYTLGEQPLNGNQIGELAEIVATLHKNDSSIPFDTENIKEDFKTPFSSDLLYFIDNKSNILDSELKQALMPHIPNLKVLISKLHSLSDKLTTRDLHFVLCHTDIHPWNIIQSNKDMILLDWEGLRLAPREADLFSFVDEGYFGQFIDTYQKYYPNYSIDQDVLNYYLTKRKVEDIWEFIEQISFDAMSLPARKNALKCLKNELENLSL